jgi:hypothetical protein
LFRTSDRKLLELVPIRTGMPLSLAFSPVGDQLIVGLFNGRLESRCGLVERLVGK